MNILIDQLPTSVEINGRNYDIDSDFRTGLRIVLAFEDDELTIEEKYQVMLTNLFPVLPNDLVRAFEIGIRFLNGGENHSEENAQGPRVYSFSRDANLIFAAFKQTHNIDLSDTEYLHWWKFLALFMDLGADTAFCNLVGLRKRIKTGKATKEEKRIAQEMGDAFDIPELDMRTPEEREQEAEFMRLVNQRR